MNVEEVMTLDPVCCSMTESADMAATLMAELGVGVIPITESASSYKLVGLVTDRDLAMKVVAPGLDPKEVMLASIMSSSIISCHPKDELEDVMTLMREKQIRRIPVVNEDNELEGIVSTADLAIHNSVSGKDFSKVLQDVSKGQDPLY